MGARMKIALRARTSASSAHRAYSAIGGRISGHPVTPVLFAGGDGDFSPLLALLPRRSLSSLTPQSAQRTVRRNEAYTQFDDFWIKIHFSTRDITAQMDM